ncbi:MAG: hypothetical protein O2816_00475 [Planctomycetota bacterium]|nr:hypothetical protein [Planctomycetota bacterium]
MHGPVRVPVDAEPGQAIMRVELPDTSKYKSFATDLEVTIE